MLVVTLLVGIACGSAAQLPKGECGEPAVQYMTATMADKALANMMLCINNRDKARTEVERRGESDNVTVFCLQRDIP